MYTKNVTQTILILLAAAMVFWFAMPFKEQVVDPLKAELSSLEEARDRYNNQINLDSLKQKINSLSLSENRLLESYIPKELHSGRLVYTVAQLAQQNRLNIKGIQYSVVEASASANLGKKLVIEFQVEGFYENFIDWIRAVELSDTLIDAESIKAGKVNNTSDVISFTVKMSAYGVKID